MKLLTSDHRVGPIDLDTTPVHLGLGGTVATIDGFDWDPETLSAYEAATSSDGPDGRLTMIYDFDDAPGTTWEKHPAGDELVVCLSGRLTLIQDTGEFERTVELAGGQAAVNPPDTWHVIDGQEAGQFLTITPGLGTSHRPRDSN